MDWLSDAGFIAVYITVPVLAVVFYKAAGIRLLQVNVPSVFLAFYLVNAYIGLIFIYFGWSGFPSLFGLTDRRLIWKLFFYSAASLLFIAVGMIAASRWMRRMRFKESHTETKRLSNVGRLEMLALVGICLLVTAVFWTQQAGIPILETLRGNQMNSAYLRNQATTLFSGYGRYHHYELFFGTFLPFAALVLLANAILVRKRMERRIALAVVATCFVVLTLDAQKYPALNFFMACILVYVISKPVRLSLGKLLFIAAAANALALAITSIVLGGRDFLGRELPAYADRILVNSLSCAYYYLQMFPDYIAFLMGRGFFPNPGGILPFEVFPMGTEVWYYMAGGAAPGSVVTTAPTAFWAGLYADFGPVAPLIGSFFVGIFLYGVHTLLQKFSSKNPLTLALTVTCALHYSKLTITGMGFMLFDIYIIPILLVALFLKKTRGLRRIKILPRRALPHPIDSLSVPNTPP